ncbi:MULTISPECIES: FeoB-associated Cys-rich membrane protein [Reichenbachiella]|uniref:Virus attachment protein p12 family protein n=1 Tax=Reichenbachiella agariperforans TaxID=156994 RepID=A0A1M6QAR2_REIAG|nr:FeoB-associated Cys-rich membrane protein [Reichenbachiella agariperforans]MBU2914297.1 FeoB-associated Cys-rich membrane protein [Reichenbachiella agariperforans]SHK17384.1 hypothetical protein SAMN04488028_103250 [Reichenbachiella agariperforans]
MIQNLIVLALFLGALWFLVKKFILKSDASAGCAGGCDKCDTAQNKQST